MFKELGPLLRQRTVVMILTRLEDDTIRVNVIPRKLNESENDALTTPLSVAGTAEDLDNQLPSALVQFVGAHLELRNTLESAKEQMAAAAKGYLLGANTRQQFLAQLAGILPGALVVGLAWSLLVPNAAALGGERLPASMAVVWKGVAEMLSHGLWRPCHPTARVGALVSAGLGLLLPLLERALPRAKAFIPSPMGLGLAFVMPRLHLDLDVRGRADRGGSRDGSHRAGRRRLRGARGLGPDRGREPDGRARQRPDGPRPGAEVGTGPGRLPGPARSPPLSSSPLVLRARVDRNGSRAGRPRRSR